MIYRGEIHNFGHRPGYMVMAEVRQDLTFGSLYLSNILGSGEADDWAADRFELAFKLADVVPVISFFMAGFGLLRNKRHSSLVLIIASSIAFYLGVLDFIFYGAKINSGKLWTPRKLTRPHSTQYMIEYRAAKAMAPDSDKAFAVESDDEVIITNSVLFSFIQGATQRCN